MGNLQITGGNLNSRKIKTEDFENVKPTLSKTRQGIFNALSSLIDFDGLSFLDMFAGSGIMSFEAVSRGFNPVYTFEKDKKTALLIKNNFKELKIEPNLYFGDSLKSIKRLGKTFDVIFIDPPYESDLYQKALNIIGQGPFLNENGIVILEHPVSKIIDLKGYNVIKQKEYSNKIITFLAKD